MTEHAYVNCADGSAHSAHEGRWQWLADRRAAREFASPRVYWCTGGPHRITHDFAEYNLAADRAADAASGT